MTMSTELEKDVKQLPVEIVAPINVDRLAEAFRTFQEFKQRLLTKEDSITIAGRQYLKKSAWRKWALACGVSDEIVSFDPSQPKEKTRMAASRTGWLSEPFMRRAEDAAPAWPSLQRRRRTIGLMRSMTSSP